MTDDALYGSYSDLKFYKSLGVARISIDVPLEQAGKIVALLGTPTQNDATWVGIARLKAKPEEAAAAKVETQERLLNGEGEVEPRPDGACSEELAQVLGDAIAQAAADDAAEQAAKPKRRFDEMSRTQQAGVLCGDPDFQNWLGNSTGCVLLDPKGCAACLRRYLGVKSRTELNNPGAVVAIHTWDGLVSDYRQATGQVAEQRG